MQSEPALLRPIWREGPSSILSTASRRDRRIFNQLAGLVFRLYILDRPNRG